jgi:hypothetical protein
MLGFAGAVDAAQIGLGFVPLVGWIAAKLLSLVMALSILLWLLFNGVKATSAFMMLFGASAVELVPLPFTDMLPLWTGIVARMAFTL